MDFTHFDTRRYPTLAVAEGYAEWAAHYERSVHDEMDLRLLERLTTVPWSGLGPVLDLACGTGRIGVWLAARVTRPDGRFVIVGFHPFFLLSGIPTHFHRPSDNEPVAIESYIHLMSDHVRAAGRAGWTLAEMEEGVVDDEWIAAKPKWAKYRHRPASYAMVWRK